MEMSNWNNNILLGYIHQYLNRLGLGRFENNFEVPGINKELKNNIYFYFTYALISPYPMENLCHP
jgi:hypothetical protein